MREVQLGPVVDQIPAIQSDDYTKVSGLTPGDFGAILWANGVVSLVAPVVSEIGAGEYLVNFTPDVVGFWVLDVSIPSLARRIRREYVVVEVTTNQQARKLDLGPTVGPGAVTPGSMLDRIANKDGTQQYNQSRDSLQALRERIG